VERNFEKAFQWYEDAAKQGYPYAQYSLALMYFNGQGVSQDDVAACAWMSLAANQGDKVAVDQLKAIKCRMSKEQVAQAEAMANQLNQMLIF
jgi:TPR repeat protein